MPRHVLISRISILHKQNSHKGKQNTLDMIILMNKYIFYRGKNCLPPLGPRSEWTGTIICCMGCVLIVIAKRWRPTGLSRNAHIFYTPRHFHSVPLNASVVLCN